MNQKYFILREQSTTVLTNSYDWSSCIPRDEINEQARRNTRHKAVDINTVE